MGHGDAWTREDWLALADRMLAAVRPYASPGHALVTLPGPEGGYGRAVDGLEGFARAFLLAGFRIAGARGAGVDELAGWYADGIAAGTDPAAFAEAVLGPLATDETRTALRRAESRAQGIALVLMAPEFQRR